MSFSATDDLCSGDRTIANAFKSGACRVAWIGDSIASGTMISSLYRCCAHKKITGVMSTPDVNGIWTAQNNGGAPGSTYGAYSVKSPGDSSVAGTIALPKEVGEFKYNGTTIPSPNAPYDLSGTYNVLLPDGSPASGGFYNRLYQYQGGDWAAIGKGLRCQMLMYKHPNAANQAVFGVYDRNGSSSFDAATAKMNNVAGTPGWTTYSLNVPDSMARNRMWVTYQLQAGTPTNNSGDLLGGVRWSSGDDGFELLLMSGAGYALPTWLNSNRGSDAVFSDYLDQRQITHVVISLGANDRTNGRDVYKANLKLMIARVRATPASVNRPVILWPCYALGDWDMSTLAQAALEVADEVENVLCLNQFACFPVWQNLYYGYDTDFKYNDGKTNTSDYYQGWNVVRDTNNHYYLLTGEYEGEFPKTGTQPKDDPTNWTDIGTLLNGESGPLITTAETRNFLLGDNGVHPTTAGTKVIAQAFWRLMDYARPSNTTADGFTTTIQVLNSDLTPAVGVPVTFRLIAPAGNQFAVSNSEVQYTSDSSGNITVNLWRNAQYAYWAGVGRHYQFVANDTVSTGGLPSIIWVDD